MPETHSSPGDRVAELLQVEKFPPPARFAARAQLSYPAVYEQAAADRGLVGGAGARAAALGYAVLLGAR